MNLRHRALLIAVLAVVATLTPAAAEAAGPPLLEPRTVLDGALTAPAGTYATACHRAYRPDARRRGDPQRGRRRARAR